MATRDLNQLDLLALSLGGADGTKRQDAAAAGTGLEVHKIVSFADAATFSVITATGQDGVSFNMLTSNNLTSKVFNTGDVLYAPFGGFISAYTCTVETEQFKLPGTGRNRQLA